jgi:hypothetical protein
MISFLLRPPDFFLPGAGKTRGCHRNLQRSTLNSAKYRCGSVRSVSGVGYAGTAEGACSSEFGSKRPNREVAAPCTINL